MARAGPQAAALSPAMAAPATPPSPASPPPEPSLDSSVAGAPGRRAGNCNLAALCQHVQSVGFGAGAFSDVVVEVMGEIYRLHRLIISRSNYFRNMLHGPWKEVDAPTLVLQIDDPNVNSEAITMALAYLYGQPPKLNDNNAFRVLAAASFLDLQDLCTMCTEYIISALCTSNFLQYQVFAEGQDYGIHGDLVRKACWGFLCQSATMELREELPKLSSQTLHALLTSDDLWVPNEEKRFELALYTLLAKSAAVSEAEVGEEESVSSKSASPKLLDSSAKGNAFGAGSREEQFMEPKSHSMQLLVNAACNAAQNSLTTRECDMNLQELATYFEPAQIDVNLAKRMGSSLSLGESSAESSTCPLVDKAWLSQDQSGDYFVGADSNGLTSNDWSRVNSNLWGGRIVRRREVKSSRASSVLPAEEYDGFIKIFEKGSLLYCNMSFEALLNARKRLEELGFPCNAVNDGLWLQMLLCNRVQAVGADTCRYCCLASNACACRHSYGYQRGVAAAGNFRQLNDRNGAPANIGNVYMEGNGEAGNLFGPVRSHVRGAADGLAGIGRGTSSVSGAAWPPRYVFSRVSLGIDESEPRVDYNGDLPGDGLTALVGLSGESSYEFNMHGRLAGTASTSCAGAPSIPMESDDPELEWDASDHFISLGLKTPLNHFPPFRFGVEFTDVLDLADGQVKHSTEVFYAGSLWKVSAQAFNEEDPQGRRTLGLFLHRRKAEVTDPTRKDHMYIDCRDKVTARYQLICPSKREVLVFGRQDQPGTLLPKAPKGWGWRTAILFGELPDLLQNNALRVIAVVQLL